VEIVIRQIERLIDTIVAVVVDPITNLGLARVDVGIRIIAVGTEAPRAEAITISVVVDAARAQASPWHTLTQRRCAIFGEASIVGERSALRGRGEWDITTFVVGRARAGL
jgi:hypothetical protein